MWSLPFFFLPLVYCQQYPLPVYFFPSSTSCQYPLDCCCRWWVSWACSYHHTAPDQPSLFCQRFDYYWLNCLKSGLHMNSSEYGGVVWCLMVLTACCSLCSSVLCKRANEDCDTNWKNNYKSNWSMRGKKIQHFPKPTKKNPDKPLCCRYRCWIVKKQFEKWNVLQWTFGSATDIEPDCIWAGIGG